MTKVLEREARRSAGTPRAIKRLQVQVAMGHASKARLKLAQMAAELAVRRVAELPEGEAARIAEAAQSAVGDPARQLAVILGREHAVEAPSTKVKAPRTVLEQAFDRADQRKAAILRDPTMLTGEAAAARLGVSRETINKRAQQGRLLALEFAKRGKRYPAWQFEEAIAGAPLEAALSVLRARDPWERYRFFTQRQPGLGGRTPIEALRLGEKEAARRVAADWATGEQGGG